MNEPRQRTPHRPRRVKGLDATNVCLLLAALLAALPWLVPPSTDALHTARDIAAAVAARVAPVTTNHGASR